MIIQAVHTFNLYSENTNRTNQITLSTKYSSFIIFRSSAITRSFHYDFYFISDLLDNIMFHLCLVILFNIDI